MTLIPLRSTEGREKYIEVVSEASRKFQQVSDARDRALRTLDMWARGDADIGDLGRAALHLRAVERDVRRYKTAKEGGSL